MEGSCSVLTWTELVPTDREIQRKLECGPMPNVMAALPNIGGTLYKSSLITFLVYHDAKFGSRPLLECRAVTLPI